MKQSRYLVRQLALAWFAAGLALVAVDVRPGVGQEPTRPAYHATYNSTLIDDGKDVIFPSAIHATDYFKGNRSRVGGRLQHVATAFK